MADVPNNSGNFNLSLLDRAARLSATALLGACLSSVALANSANTATANTATATATTQAVSEDDLAAVVVARNGAINDTLRTAGEPLSPLTESVHDFTDEMSDEGSDNGAVATAQTPTASSAPSVTHDKLILNEPVVDAARILSASEKAHLSDQLRALYNDNLAQAALVIIPSTEGMPIFDYAMAVADRWQLGKKDTDEGLLIVVAINDRDLYILTGYGLEGVLPDAALKRIIRQDITPAFKSGQYAQGLSAGIASIGERLRADPETLKRADAAIQEEESFGEESVSLFGLLIIGFIFGTFLTSIFGRVLGATIAAGGVGFMGMMAGAGFMVIPIAIVLWLILLFFKGGSGGGRGGRGGRGGGGFVVLPTGSGGFGGGGFGSGGFGGGGGGFGGGGAGGSW